MDTQGNVYFSLTENGETIVQPIHFFPDWFCGFGFAQYGIAAQDQEFTKNLPKRTYLNILKKKDNPRRIYGKKELRQTVKKFALPMILSNLLIELEEYWNPTKWSKAI